MPGVWTEELIAARSGGDAFALIRIASGTAAPCELNDRDRLLVVSGSVEMHADDEAPTLGQPGDFLAPTATSVTSRAPGPATVLLRITASGLGGSLSAAYGPGGWFPASPGVWAKLLISPPDDVSTFDERIAGLTWFEAGATSDRNPHPTAHRFLFLSGNARDELIISNGGRYTADRQAGDFVDYPTGIEHRTHSRGGCRFLFVHEGVEHDLPTDSRSTLYTLASARPTRRVEGN